MIKACIFDIDGTLLNTLENLCNCISEAMEYFGYERLTTDVTKVFVGDGYQKFVERSLLHCGDTKLEHYEEACKMYQGIFREKCLQGIFPYDGIREALETLKEHGILLGVLSNKQQHGADANMNKVFGEHYFTKVLGEQQGIPRKPDPFMLLAMMKELGLKKDEVMYFGDTNTDMETGKAAGVITVGVTWGFRDEQELASFSPEYIIHSPGEIVGLALGERA